MILLHDDFSDLYSLFLAQIRQEQNKDRQKHQAKVAFVQAAFEERTVKQYPDIVHTEDGFDNMQCIHKAVSPEKYPGKIHQQKCTCHADHFMRQRISVQAQPVYQFIAYRLQHFPYYLVKTVYSAPRYVRKLCPVPKPTYQKHDYLVQVLTGFSLAAATHRDV